MLQICTCAAKKRYSYNEYLFSDVGYQDAIHCVSARLRYARRLLYPHRYVSVRRFEDGYHVFGKKQCRTKSEL